MLAGYVNLFSKIVPICTLTWSIDFPLLYLAFSDFYLLPIEWTFLYILLINDKILSISFYLAI